jgi:hypothetical protein
MNKIKMRVAFAAGSDMEDGTYSVTPVVQVAFEREYRIGIGRAFGEGGEMRQEHMFWLAWKAMHAAGKIVKPFDGWLEELAEIEIVNDVVPPTTAGAR